MMEGEMILEYGPCIKDLITILLRNGYSLSMSLLDNGKNIKIWYFK